MGPTFKLVEACQEGNLGRILGGPITEYLGPHSSIISPLGSPQDFQVPVSTPGLFHTLDIYTLSNAVKHPEVPFLGPPPSVFMALYGLYKETSVAHYQIGATRDLRGPRTLIRP